MAHNKITFFISSLNSGGAERQCALIANDLVRRNFKVTICSFNSAPSFYSLSPEVEHRPLGVLSRSGRLFERLYSIFRRLFVVRKILSEAPEGTVFVSFMDITNMLCILSSIGLSQRLVAMERSDPSHQPRSRIVKFLRSLIYRRAGHIVVQSQSAQKYFATFPRVSVLRNIATNLNSPKPPNSLPRGKSLPFVCISRLSKEKGVPELVKSFQQFAKEILPGEVTLDIYGTGPLLTELSDYLEQQKLTEMIHLKGLHPNIAQNLHNYSALLLHSQYEGFPNVILEGLSSGLQVIATPTAGSNEIYRLINSPRLILAEPSHFPDTLTSFYKGFQHGNHSSAKALDLSSFSSENVVDDFLAIVQSPNV